MPRRKPLHTSYALYHLTNCHKRNQVETPSSAYVDFRRCWLLADAETRPSLERVTYCVFKNFQPFQLLIFRPVHQVNCSIEYGAGCLTAQVETVPNVSQKSMTSVVRALIISIIIISESFNDNFIVNLWPSPTVELF